MGFGSPASLRPPQGSGGGSRQLSTQIRSADGGAEMQSQTPQKLQSICAHEATVLSCARQPAMQPGFVEQRPEMRVGGD